MEAYCLRCRHYDEEHDPAAGAACPRCQGFLQQRKGPPPSPGTHLGALLSTVFSLPGVIVLAVTAVLIGLPLSGYTQKVGLLILYLTAVKLSYKAMNTEGGRIAFPELDPREFFQPGTVGPVVVYSLVFMILPVLLVQLGIGAEVAGVVLKKQAEESWQAEELDNRAEAVEQGYDPDNAAEWAGEGDEDGEPESEAVRRAREATAGGVAGDRKAKAEQLRTQAQQLRAAEVKKAGKAGRGLVALRVASFAGAALLLLYAAMALVLFLRTNTIGGMFGVGAGFQLIRRDLRGYMALSGMVLVANAFRLFADAGFIRRHLVAAVPTVFVSGMFTLIVYGMCGLYVRRHARALDLPCDDDDWTPMTGAAPAAVRAAPAAAPSRGGAAVAGGLAAGNTFPTGMDTLSPSAAPSGAAARRAAGPSLWPPPPLPAQPVAPLPHWPPATSPVLAALQALQQAPAPVAPAPTVAEPATSPPPVLPPTPSWGPPDKV